MSQPWQKVLSEYIDKARAEDKPVNPFDCLKIICPMQWSAGTKIIQAVAEGIDDESKVLRFCATCDKPLWIPTEYGEQRACCARCFTINFTDGEHADST